MGLAKYAEEIRNRRSRAAELIEEPTHPTIPVSRSKPAGRSGSVGTSLKKLVNPSRKKSVKSTKQDRMMVTLKVAEQKSAEMKVTVDKFTRRNEALIVHNEFLSRRVAELEAQIRPRLPMLTIRE